MKKAMLYTLCWICCDVSVIFLCIVSYQLVAQSSVPVFHDVWYQINNGEKVKVYEGEKTDSFVRIVKSKKQHERVALHVEGTVRLSRIYPFFYELWGEDCIDELYLNNVLVTETSDCLTTKPVDWKQVQSKMYLGKYLYAGENPFQATVYDTDGDSVDFRIRAHRTDVVFQAIKLTMILLLASYFFFRIS